MELSSREREEIALDRIVKIGRVLYNANREDLFLVGKLLLGDLSYIAVEPSKEPSKEPILSILGDYLGKSLEELEKLEKERRVKKWIVIE